MVSLLQQFEVALWMDYTLNVAACKNFSFYILWYPFNRITMSQKRKVWSQESMRAAVQSVQSVQEGKGLREASRPYNVPIGTLR